MKTTKKIGIFNNKGGVAKTTSIINLAYAFSKNGKRTLVVDCDNQENCFSFFFSDQSGNGILDTEYEGIKHWGWSCTGYKEGCKFHINKKIAGKTITEKQAILLCQ